MAGLPNYPTMRRSGKEGMHLMALPVNAFHTRSDSAQHTAILGLIGWILAPAMYVLNDRRLGWSTHSHWAASEFPITRLVVVQMAVVLLVAQIVMVEVVAVAEAVPHSTTQPNKNLYLQCLPLMSRG
jgi:hypothetical protein